MQGALVGLMIGSEEEMRQSGGGGGEKTPWGNVVQNKGVPEFHPRLACLQRRQ